MNYSSQEPDSKVYNTKQLGKYDRYPVMYLKYHVDDLIILKAI